MLGKQHWLAEWENVTNFWLDANIWDLCICLRAHRRILHKGVTWRSQGFMWLTYRQNTSWINYFNLKNTLLSHYSYFSGLFYLLIPVWVTHTISHAYAYAYPKLQKAVWYSHTYTHTRKKPHEHQTFHPLTPKKAARLKRLSHFSALPWKKLSRSFPTFLTIFELHPSQKWQKTDFGFAPKEKEELWALRSLADRCPQILIIFTF